MSTESKRVATIATALHRAKCQSLWWSDDCRRDDGGHHAIQVWRPRVREALRSADPAMALHTLACDADLDPNHGCPDRERHTADLVTRLNEITGSNSPTPDQGE